jgi:hypothetical protein
VILERIKKWRATQLTPWKAKAAADTSAGSAAAASGSASSSKKSSKDKAKGSSRVDGPVAQVYSVYSSMEIGSSCLGLHRDCFLQLLKDSRVIGDRYGE